LQPANLTMPGRRTFSDAPIEAALAVTAVYRLALRQAEGLVASIFALLGLALPVPDHTTLSRRGRALRLDRRVDVCPGGVDLAIDSTGLRLLRPGDGGAAGWRKLHVAVDPDTGRILAEEVTPSDVHDTRPVPAMLGRIAGRVGRVYGDGAYAGGPTHRAVTGRRQCPPKAEGVFRPRAPAVRAAARLDPLTARGRHARHVAREGRAAWERATGYGRRNAAEWTFSRLERVLGGTLRSRHPAAQSAEAAVAARVLNRMAEIGMPRAQRVA
jgi:DDE family transposase